MNEEKEATMFLFYVMGSRVNATKTLIGVLVLYNTVCVPLGSALKIVCHFPGDSAGGPCKR